MTFSSDFDKISIMIKCEQEVSGMSDRLADKEAVLYSALGDFYKRENVFVFDTIDSTNTFLKE